MPSIYKAQFHIRVTTYDTAAFDHFILRVSTNIIHYHLISIAPAISTTNIYIFLCKSTTRLQTQASSSMHPNAAIRGTYLPEPSHLPPVPVQTLPICSMPLLPDPLPKIPSPKPYFDVLPLGASDYKNMIEDETIWSAGGGVFFLFLSCLPVIGSHTWKKKMQDNRGRVSKGKGISTRLLGRVRVSHGMIQQNMGERKKRTSMRILGDEVDLVLFIKKAS